MTYSSNELFKKYPYTYIEVGLRKKVRGLTENLSPQNYKGSSECKTTRSNQKNYLLTITKVADQNKVNGLIQKILSTV